MAERRFDVPSQLEDILLEFTVSVLINKPENIIWYAAEYFTRLHENEINKQSRLSITGCEYSNSVSDGEHDSLLSDDEVTPHPSGLRRKSVFAEAYNPEEDDDECNRVVFPKSDEQRLRLAESVRKIFLFRSLDPMQMQEILDAMFEKKVDPGDNVIQQGDDGDNFYVIESGNYSIFVGNNDAEPTKVGDYDDSGSFGELALMYNMPRAATITANTEGCLWAMDRQTFRRIVLRNAFRKRKMYETFLGSVPMLKTLEPYERMNLADALVPKKFEDGQRIIQQGDQADGMYFIEEGQVKVMREEPGQAEKQVKLIESGGYVGELALITKKPRAASADAVGTVSLAFLDREAFERLLGPCMDVMKRKVENYEEELQNIFGADVNLLETDALVSGSNL